MRNNAKDIVIHHLIETTQRKKSGYSEYDYYLQNAKELEEKAAKIAKLKAKQQAIEEGGYFVEVRRGLSIFVKNCENCQEKVQAYLSRLEEAERSGKILIHRN
jgi:hypothetical protein